MAEKKLNLGFYQNTLEGKNPGKDMTTSSEAQYGPIIQAQWVPEANSQPGYPYSLDISKLLEGISQHYQKKHQQDKTNSYFQVLLKTEHRKNQKSNNWVL